MWLFTTVAAFRIMERPRCPAGDTRTLQVRARRVPEADGLEHRYHADRGGW
jgi:hypothetical protein